MKYTITATAIVFATIAFTGTPSRATLSGQYLWQGDFFITAATPQCSSEGKNVGAFGQMVFQPKKLPGNDPNQDKLVIFPSWKLSAMQWVSNTPSTSGLLNGATSVTMTGVDASGAYSNSKTVKSLTVSPKAPSTTTPSVAISLTMTESSGCTITAAGHLAGPF